MKQKNILFTDMDGTILFSDNGKTYFKESDLDAIKEFRQRGNLQKLLQTGWKSQITRR